MKLETERLILRSPRMSDWKDLVEGIGNLKISKNLMVVPHPYTKKDAINRIQACIKTWKKKKKEKYPFFIELKSERKIIGAISLNMDIHNKTGSTGSWINEKYQGKGYITEAKIAVNEFAFNKLSLRKLETAVYFENPISNRVQKKVGYKYEGCKKQNILCKATGKIHDTNIYGLFKKDWKKALPQVKKHLKEKIKKLEKENE